MLYMISGRTPVAQFSSVQIGYAGSIVPTICQFFLKDAHKFTPLITSFSLQCQGRVHTHIQFEIPI